MLVYKLIHCDFLLDEPAALTKSAFSLENKVGMVLGITTQREKT